VSKVLEEMGSKVGEEGWRTNKTKDARTPFNPN
jgi:hypothetical protein